MTEKNRLPTTTQQSKPPATIQDMLRGESFRSAIEAALPTHLKPERFIRIALTAITRQPKLSQCDQASFFQALLTLSQLGLEPDGRRAHLIPFENRKRGVVEVQLIVDYKGLVELVMRTGNVSFIHADVVRDRDEFEYDRGEIKHHRINLREDRGDVYAVYAFVRFKDGTEKCEVMSVADVERIRQRSRAANNGPWVTDWDEMAKKTCFRRLSKWVELSPEQRDIVEADDDQYELLAEQGRHTRAMKRTAMKVDDLIGVKPENGHDTEPEANPEDILKPDWVAEDPTTGLPVPNVAPAPEPPTAEAAPDQESPERYPDIVKPQSFVEEQPAKRKPEKPKPDGVGPKSSAWPRLNSYQERLGPKAHAIIVETKERLGWPNTPINALSTQQIIAICEAIDIGY
jgi:recombination protein RecT